MLLQKLSKLFHAWELPISVILSLLIQIILVLFGSRRKISRATFTMFLVWYTYINAESVVNFVLRHLIQNEGKSCKEEPQGPQPNHQLYLLWPPFLVLHLGTPDTITAYSLPDNNLWARHLVHLVTLVGMALFAVVRYWNKRNPLRYLVFPIFVSGVARSSEKVWAQNRSASPQRVLNSLFQGVLESPPKGTPPEGTYLGPPECTFLGQVCDFLATLTKYFADNLGSAERDTARGQKNIILNQSPRQAFRLVETELGLIYDSLYTKALFIYICPWAIYLRCVYFLSSIVTLASFYIIIHKPNKVKWSYPSSDVVITYILMIGDIILEIYAAILIVLSDWTLIWLCKHNNNSALRKFLFRNIPECSRAILGEKRWSRSINQHNILANCARPGNRRKRDVFTWKNHGVSSGRAVEELEGLVFKVIEKSPPDPTHPSDGDPSDYISHLARMKPSEVFRGIAEHVFRKYHCLEKFHKRPFRSKFDRSIFIWHIATTLCYYSDTKNEARKVGWAKGSIRISDYFMYLASRRQILLPAGKYDSIYNDTREQIHRISGQRRRWCCTLLKNMGDVCKQLLEDKERDQDEKDTQYAAAKEGALIAVALREIETRWKIIGEVWAYMLLYAASQIEWEEHAKYLTAGGEFITHVAVFLVHASLAKQQTENDESGDEWDSGDAGPAPAPTAA